MELENLNEAELLLYKKRHSMSHILAKAIKEIYGNDVKLAIGPAIDTGFYYDFDNLSINEDEFEKIENKMREIVLRQEDFVYKQISKQDALEMFKDEPYKVELINELEDGEISIYYTGEDFVDLCKGPHIENSKYLRSFAFKLARVSGAYWRGSEKNKMLQRIYAYGFDNQVDLKDYLKMLKEAELRDHRKLGPELNLFFLSEYAPGMPFYMDKGMVVKNTLIDFWRQMHKRANYIEIDTPTILNRKLWETSGHWAHYKDNMYAFDIEESEFAIKPMNCPGSIIYYKQAIHSYKDLPLRVAELGKVFRHEASGTLHGLFRVRSFTQDDAHIFLYQSQIEDEVKRILDLVDEVYSTFGLSYHLELSTMPEDHLGEEADWRANEQALANAITKIGKTYKLNPGDGAFYGPKIDIHIKDAIGRTWQCGTIQLDSQLPKLFDAEYVDSDGSRKEPILIHRVVFGSVDRFFGILTENFAGAFPLWLSPVQVKVMNISDNSKEYAEKVRDELNAAGIRVELDDRNEKIGKKIRDGQMQKNNYMLIVGDSEAAEGKVSVRHRKAGDLGVMDTNDFIQKVLSEIASKDLNA